jgi:hypothetical protein
MRRSLTLRRSIQHFYCRSASMPLLLFGNNVYTSLQNLLFTPSTARGARLPSRPCRNHNKAVIIVVTGNAKHGLHSRICIFLKKAPPAHHVHQPPETHPSTYPDPYILVSSACTLPPGHLPRPAHTQNAIFCIRTLGSRYHRHFHSSHAGIQRVSPQVYLVSIAHWRRHKLHSNSRTNDQGMWWHEQKPAMGQMVPGMRILP